MMFANDWVRYGPLSRNVNLRVAYVPGMLKTFSPPPRASDPDMHYDTCVIHVPWCIAGSLTSGLLWSRWPGKRSRHSRRMHNQQFCVSGKRPMAWRFFVCLYITLSRSRCTHLMAFNIRNVYKACTVACVSAIKPTHPIFLQFMRLFLFSLPIYPLVIVRKCAINLIIITRSEIWICSHCHQKDVWKFDVYILLTTIAVCCLWNICSEGPCNSCMYICTLLFKSNGIFFCVGEIWYLFLRYRLEILCVA